MRVTHHVCRQCTVNAVGLSDCLPPGIFYFQVYNFVDIVLFPSLVGGNCTVWQIAVSITLLKNQFTVH